MPTFTIANMGILKRLPEAICCTCNVDVVLLVMYCMYIPAFIVTSADIYLCYLYCRRLFVVVYKLVMFMECGHCITYVYKLSWSLVLTSASYRYI